MARKKQSMAEDVVDITSQLHWGVGTSLAVVSYLALSWYAGQEVTVEAGLENLSTNIINNGLKVAATFGQYILPFIFGLGALISIFNRKKRKQVHEDVRASITSSPLDNISWSEFELLVGEDFRHQGFKVQETGSGADGGIDLILNKDGAKYFVQCKQWKAYKVGVKVVRELLGAMVGEGAAGGFVVTSGHFTQDAIKFAVENNITLIDGTKLKRIISTGVQSKVNASQKAVPLCPKCGKNMVKRVAKKGPRVGEEFWGCSTFPKCRATLPFT